MSETITAAWVLKANKNDILKNRKLVENYLEIKEKTLEGMREKTPDSFACSYAIYRKALLKIKECGMRWKLKKF